MTKITFKIFRYAFLGLGLFLLAGIIKKMGWSAIAGHLAHLKWFAIPIFLVGALWYLFYTLAWKQILKLQGTEISLWTLFKAKIAGETVNAMQPTDFLAGDPMRIYLLRHTSNVPSLAASVVMDRTVNSLAIVATIFAAFVTALFTLPNLPRGVAIGIPIFLLVCSGAIVFLLIRQQKGLFSSLLRLAKRLRLATHLATKHLPHAEELDEQVLSLYQKSHTIFWEVLFFHLAGRFLGIVEVYLIGRSISEDFTFLFALFLAGLAPVIRLLFTFVPGLFGVLEGAYSGALYLLGMEPALGVTIQLVKRIRATVWYIFGMCVISLNRSPRTSDDNKGPLQQPL